MPPTPDCSAFGERPHTWTRRNIAGKSILSEHAGTKRACQRRRLSRRRSTPQEEDAGQEGGKHGELERAAEQETQNAPLPRALFIRSPGGPVEHHLRPVGRCKERHAAASAQTSTGAPSESEAGRVRRAGSPLRRLLGRLEAYQRFVTSPDPHDPMTVSCPPALGATRRATSAGAPANGEREPHVRRARRRPFQPVPAAWDKYEQRRGVYPTRDTGVWALGPIARTAGAANRWYSTLLCYSGASVTISARRRWDAAHESLSLCLHCAVRCEHAARYWQNTHLNAGRAVPRNEPSRGWFLSRHCLSSTSQKPTYQIHLHQHNPLLKFKRCPTYTYTPRRGAHSATQLAQEIPLPSTPARSGPQIYVHTRSDSHRTVQLA